MALNILISGKNVSATVSCARTSPRLIAWVWAPALSSLLWPGIIAAQAQTHMGVMGDTLDRIAAQYGVTTYHLMELNGLTSEKLYLGQVLAIEEMG